VKVYYVYIAQRFWGKYFVTQNTILCYAYFVKFNRKIFSLAVIINCFYWL